ncbi:aromatic acid/H+ symport family MFS transporter [Gordonia sp. TBRC 11910]|uniref:Aromatic acid/H+ symport family MFS transporter n=1 Tax=Gordonia asplenii TaxID=2725283 RepID=A0A848KV20_9ACTN|nr:MFS transporter [Gordonia asplenii]NMO00705.1 aromatic acid/H+ symport family MFS transporter [Gordonia asplenii]
MTTSTSGAAARSLATSGLGVAVLCMFLNLVDGFDLLVISFVLPTLPDGFATTFQQGLLVSIALVGMAVGAIGLARFADRYGRRLIALVGIGVNLGGLVLSSLAPNVEVMMLARFITGAGIGMISVVIVVAAQESAAPKQRNLATGLVMVGYPLGSVLAAVSTDAIRSAFGENWQAMYLTGAVLALIAFVAAHLGLPESVKKSAKRPVKNSATASASLPKAPSLLGRELVVVTVLLCVGYMTVSGVFNFAAGLTPAFMKAEFLKGLDPVAKAAATSEAGDIAQRVGLALSLGCLVGAVSLAIVGLVVSATRLAWIYSVIGVVSMIGFAGAFPGAGERPGAQMYVFAFALGVGVFGGISSFSALVPAAYPVSARAKGYGAMLGFGRAGAIAAPLITAWAVAKVDAQTLYNLTNIGLVISLCCAVALVAVMRSRATATRPVQPSDAVASMATPAAG